MNRDPSLLPLAALVALAGCATTNPGRSLSEVNGMVRDRSGLETGLAAGGDAVDEQVRRFLEQPLTADAAARLALLRNAAFRARLNELGIAQAELAQAGILENPRVHASWRTIKGGGAQQPGRELGISENLLDLFELPLRRRLASAQLEQAKFRLGDDILALAAEAKQAFYAYQAARQRLDFRRRVVESFEAGSELSTRQRTAGNLNRLDLASERAMLHEARIELARAEAEAVGARERLALLIGAKDGPALQVPAELPEPPAVDPDAAAAEALAVAQRWDLQAARREPDVLRQALRINRLGMFGPVNVGIDSEKEFSGEYGYGPSADFGLPLFDRRQASAARIKAQRLRALASADALESEIRRQVRAVSAQLTAARTAAQTYREALVPDRQEILAETLKQYNFMLLGVYQLLQAKRGEVDAVSRYIDALREYWSERAELERVIGGKLPEAPAAPAQEPNAPAPTEPAPEHEHHHGGH